MTNERDKIKSKIVKLLSKTEDKGCSEAEAVMAAEKAAELMTHYDIEATELDFRSTSCVKKSAKLRKYGNKIVCDTVSVQIARLCDVRGWKSSYEGEKYYFGFEQDVDIALYLYDLIGTAILNELEAYKNSEEYEEAKANGYHGISLISSFFHGIHDRLCERIRLLADEKKQNVAKSVNALVPVKMEKINDEFGDLGMKLSKSKSYRYGSHAGTAYKAGQASANKISISQGVNSNARKAIS